MMISGFIQHRKFRPKFDPTQIHAFFCKQRFFSTQPQCCLTFSWTELQMLLRCCLMHKNIIMLIHFLHLLYLCPCLDLGLVMIYFSFLSLFPLWLVLWIQTHLFFCLQFKICPNIFRWEGEWKMWLIFQYQKFSFRVLRSLCLIFCQFQPGVAYKSIVGRNIGCICVGLY